MAVGLSFALKHFLFLQVNYSSQNYGSSWQYCLSSKHFEGHENIKLIKRLFAHTTQDKCTESVENILSQIQTSSHLMCAIVH